MFFLIVLFILQFCRRMKNEKCINHCCTLLPRVNRLRYKVIFKMFNDREEKNSILQSYFLKEELSVFMTRCCRRKNKGLFIESSDNSFRFLWYSFDVFSSRLTSARRVEKRGKRVLRTKLILVSGVSLSLKTR